MNNLDKLLAYVGIADKSSVYSRCYYLDFHDQIYPTMSFLWQEETILINEIFGGDYVYHLNFENVTLDT